MHPLLFSISSGSPIQGGPPPLFPNQRPLLQGALQNIGFIGWVRPKAAQEIAVAG
jgi:hypothetical protein